MSNIYYAKTHEWAAVEGTKAKIGISDFAQQKLGDLVFVSLPSVGETVRAGECFCEVESVKAVSEVYSPVDGKIIAVNEALEDAPELINEDAMSAWICEVELKGKVQNLLDEEGYKLFSENE